MGNASHPATVMNLGDHKVQFIVLGALTLFPIDWAISTAISGATPPGLDPNVVFTSVFAAVPGLAAAFVAFLAWRSAEETKHQAAKAATAQAETKDLVDGITSKRLQEVSAAARAEGISEGRTVELARQADAIEATAKAAAAVLETARLVSVETTHVAAPPRLVDHNTVTLPAATPVTLDRDTDVVQTSTGELSHE